MIDRDLNYGRHLIRRYLEIASPYERVLDLGAGHGTDLLIARDIQADASLLALESYPPYVTELEEKGVRVFSADIERDSLPFDNNSIDVIVMNQIMEHVKDVFWILHEVSRVLQPNGYFIVGVPNLASLHNRILLLLGKQPSVIKNHSAHVRGYTKGDFKNLLNSGFPNGYKLVKRGGSNFYPFPPSLAKPLAATLPNMAWGCFMLWQKVAAYSDGYLQYPVKARLETKFYLGK